MACQTTSSTSSSSRAEKYLIAEQVGKGSFGAANVVINKETKKKYVLKRIRLARLSDWQRRSSFQELQLVSSLDHPFVVPFVEGWVDRGHTINIVYGYCRNGDLGSLLHSHKGHFSEDRLKTWLAQALLGLEYIHKAGVLHRDIKSSNLFLTRDYDIQIGDFGLSTIRDGKTGEPDYSVVGTPHYMSPELLSKQRYGFPTDIWSLGCVMYELTALKPAFNAFNMHGLIHKIRKASLAPLPSQYSSDWRSIIKSMLRKAANKRPSVSDLINAPCMREAVLKACKRAKQINKHFCYTDLADETPDYWKPPFPLGRSEDGFKDRSSPKEEEEEEIHHEERIHRVQQPLRSEETSCLGSDDHDEDAEPSRQQSETPSSPKTITEESESDQPSTSDPKPDPKEEEEEEAPEPPIENEDETTEEHQADQPEDLDAQPSKDLCDSEGSTVSEEERCDSGSDPVIPSVDSEQEPPDGIAFCSDTPPGPIEEDAETKSRIKEERDPEKSADKSAHEGLPYKIDVVDVKKLDAEAERTAHEELPYKVDVVDLKKLDAEAETEETYTSSHWCNPSHMSAFIDGKRCDGLEAIPEGSCEEADTLMWQSLPAPAGEVFSIASPRRDAIHDFQNSLTSQPDPQASQSFWGESPSQLDPRLSSVATGSLGVDTQKRVDTLEQVLALCASLYSRGRWHELGHILNQTSKNCLHHGHDTPEPARTRLNLCTGDRVVVGTVKPFHAIVRYYGPMACGGGDWVGLELDTPAGNTDGTVNGISYFSCPKDCGLFVKASMFDKNEN